MARTEHERRRFITRHDVEDAAAAGRPVQVRARDVLTDEAAQRARDLGVTVEREGGRASDSSGGGAASSRPGPAASGGAGAGGAATAEGSVSADRLRQAVRAAVVAELGREPAGLDAAIDRVLARRGR